MKGLLLKDFYIAKSNILVTAVCLIALGFGFSFLMETSALLVLAPAVSTTSVLISITSDASSKWNKNVIAMPVSRSQIIGGKYLMYILLSIIGGIVALIPCYIIAFFRHEVTVYSLCLYGVIGIGVALLSGSISLLCAYLFDPEKSQVVFMMSFIGATLMIVAIVLFMNLFIPVKQHMFLVFGIVLIISIILFALSYKLSAKLYKRSDLQ